MFQQVFLNQWMSVSQGKTNHFMPLPWSLQCCAWWWPGYLNCFSYLIFILTGNVAWLVEHQFFLTVYLLQTVCEEPIENKTHHDINECTEYQGMSFFHWGIEQNRHQMTIIVTYFIPIICIGCWTGKTYYVSLAPECVWNKTYNVTHFKPELYIFKGQWNWGFVYCRMTLFMSNFKCQTLKKQIVQILPIRIVLI